MVKNYVESRSKIVKNFSISAPSFFKKDTIKVSATKESVHNAENSNQIFLDVIENLWVTFNSSNKIIQSGVEGVMTVKSYLTGNPQVSINFKDTKLFKYYLLHQTVRSEKFQSEKLLTLQPQIGEFNLINYRLDKFFSIPFQVTPYINLENDFKLEIEIELKNELNNDQICKQLTLKLNIPEQTSSIHSDIKKGDKEEQFEYDQKIQKAIWNISRFKG